MYIFLRPKIVPEIIPKKSYMNIASTVSNTAPGTPSSPTVSIVITFIPMCNPQVIPAKLINQINIPPKIEFNINLNIIFNGTNKIFPIINIAITHAKYTSNIFISIFLLPLIFYFLPHSMLHIGQLLHATFISFILLSHLNIFSYYIYLFNFCLNSVKYHSHYASYFNLSTFVTSNSFSFASFIK